MSLSDASDVDDALVSVLLNDATLQSMLPDGVYFTVAAQNAQRYVVIDRITHLDEYEFQDVAWEQFRYSVIAVALNTTGADVKSAAQRIHELLQDNYALPITGYTVMRCCRGEGGAIRTSKLDPRNVARRWQYRGAFYVVQVCPTG